MNHEIQSRAHKKLVDLQKETKTWEALDKYCEKAKSVTQEETECKNELEQRVGEMFGTLPRTTQRNELPVTEKID
jgi:hypothetical protein